MDNCSANQTTCELDNIELKFLPPNTTARLQPLERRSSLKQSVANCFRKAGFVTAEHSEACEDGDDDE
ncbi:hypothetical protein HPB48_009505 [Haemaphysalis longicornis]|uniref:Uncharacterized protein n=1 Tax=Haemaphysalis longicornis TaxID=44386 RepID=A0A9J6GGI1_HAELO|nr:hypothetical protein HPB48_009505 [Haemaphysalis longicornis]